MDMTGTSLVSTIAGLVGVLLALSILVQVIQELWKFLTGSKSRAYAQVLQDFLGPWATRLLRPGVLPDFTVRTAFQVRRFRPHGALLPLGKKELVAGLERTAPAWVQRALQALDLETELQAGKSQPASAEWEAFLSELGNAEKGSQGFWIAREIALFLGRWGYTLNEDTEGARLGDIKAAPGNFSSAEFLTAFRNRFVPQVVSAERGYDQMMQNFVYAYDRRNVRQTFTIAILVAFCLNLPFDRIYIRANAMSPDQATALLEQAHELYQAMPSDSLAASGDTEEMQRADERLDDLMALAERAVALAAQDGGEGSAKRLNRIVAWDQLARNFDTAYDAALYLLGCLLTAVLVSFGAPFWNNIASSLLNYQRGAKAAAAQAREGTA